LLIVALAVSDDATGLVADDDNIIEIPLSPAHS
jgi:hypothetical protein